MSNNTNKSNKQPKNNDLFTPPSTTKLDRSFDASNLTESLSNSTHTLETLSTKLSERNLKKSVDLLETIRPSLKEISNDIENHAKVLSPNCSISYSFNKSKYISKLEKQTQERIQNKQNNKREAKSLDVAALNPYIASGTSSSSSSAPVKKKSRPVGQQMKKEGKENTFNSLVKHLPRPKNGEEYQPREFCLLITHMFPNTDQRNDLKGMMLDYLYEEKLVPIQPRGMNKMLGRFKKGESVKEFWNQTGRPSLLAESEGLEPHLKNII